MTRKRKVPWNRELFGCRSLDFRTFSIIREHAHVLGRVALLRQRFQDIRQLLRRGLSPACRMNCNRRKSSLWRVTPIPGLIREIHAASESFQYNAPIGRGNCNRTLMDFRLFAISTVNRVLQRNAPCTGKTRRSPRFAGNEPRSSLRPLAQSRSADVLSLRADRLTRTHLVDALSLFPFLRCISRLSFLPAPCRREQLLRAVP